MRPLEQGRAGLAPTLAMIAAVVAAPLDAQDDRHVLAPDHLGCLVDDATLEAVGASDFLPDAFAHSRYGGAPPPRSNYFIHGELTYVELINPRLAGVLGVQVGDCMIALNTERAGWLERLYEEAGRLHPESNPEFGLRELNRGPDAIPWYYVLDFSYQSGIGGLGLWFKEYHPDFKHRMAPELSEPGDVSRHRPAPQVAFHPDKFFREATGVTVAVPPARQTQLESLLELAGFAGRVDGGSATWSTDEFEIEIVPATAEGDYAIREIRLDLTHPYSGTARTFDFGSVTLEFPEDGAAVLRFGRPAR